MTTLANEGLLGDRPVLLNDDGAGEPVAGSVVTDSLRRRTVNFGQLRTNYSPTLTAAQPADTFLSTDDYTDPAWSKYQAVAQYTGIKNVTAPRPPRISRRSPASGRPGRSRMRPSTATRPPLGVRSIRRPARPVDPG